MKIICAKGQSVACIKALSGGCLPKECAYGVEQVITLPADYWTCANRDCLGTWPKSHKSCRFCGLERPTSPASSSKEEQSAQVGEVFPESYCLHCEKTGHRTNDCWSTHAVNARSREIDALSTAQPQADAGVSREPLTDLQVHRIVCAVEARNPRYTWKDMARAIEAAHGISPAPKEGEGNV